MSEKFHISKPIGPMTPTSLYGKMANVKSSVGEFFGALDIINRAIQEYPYDPRLYNNRCFYYMKVGLYKWALSDAEYMVKTFPLYWKGHHTKVELLLEMKQRNAAREAFYVLLNVIHIDNVVSFRQLCSAQVELIFDDKNLLHPMYGVIPALPRSPNATEQNSSLVAGQMNWGENSGINNRHVLHPHLTRVDPMSIKGNASRVDSYLFIDPRNPFESYSIWVGNVTPTINEDKLRSLFCLYGLIDSVNVYHERCCAFINYRHHHMAANAMKYFPQNCCVEDALLFIRYPYSSKLKQSWMANRFLKK